MQKRLFDIVFSGIGLVITAPIFFVIAILISLSSRGPVFYRGMRTGMKGREFKIYKFRSMYRNSEKTGGDTTALGDPRITPVGHYLRRYKIDEIPQLINVFLGHMSFVGPRPELPYYTDRYDEVEKCILDVKPGITDISSLKYHALDERVGSQNADEVFEREILKQKNALRIEYVRNSSFMFDMKIIAMTIAVIFKRALKDMLQKLLGPSESAV